MEPATVLAKIACGAAALMPSGQIEKKPIQVYVYLGKWQNDLSKTVNFETVENEGATQESRKSLIDLEPKTTDINKEVEIKKSAARIYADDNYLLHSCIDIKPHENDGCSLRLYCQRLVSQDSRNGVDIRMSWHMHTRQVTSSCPLFEKSFVWNPHEPLKSIYLIVNGTITNENMSNSTLGVQEIRCAKVPSLLELTMQVISHLIEEKKIQLSAIPQDKHEIFNTLRLIKKINTKNIK